MKYSRQSNLFFILRDVFVKSLKLASSTIQSATLKFILLGLLGLIYQTTETSQAEKMLTASFGLASSSHHHLFASLIGTVLQEWYERYQNPKAAQQAQLTRQHTLLK